MKNFVIAIALMLSMVATSYAGESACEAQCVARCAPVRKAVGATVGVAAKVAEAAAKVAVAPLKLLQCFCDKAAQPVCRPAAVVAKPCEPVVVEVKPCEQVAKPVCETVCRERCKPVRKALNALKPKCKVVNCAQAVEVKPCGC